MIYDIDGNELITGSKQDGVFPVFNANTIYTNENPDGIFANVNSLYSAYDAVFDGLTVDKNLLGYATSSSGAQDTNYPIYEYVLHNSLENGVQIGRLYAPPKILLTSGVHGDEPTATLGLFNLTKSIVGKTNPVATMLRNSCQFRIVPMVNPWGYDNYNRLNAHGVNINRNFGYNWNKDWEEKGTEPYSEYETKALKAWADAQANGAMFHIDFHNHLASQTNNYFYIATEIEKMKQSFNVVCRGLFDHFAAQNINLANYEWFQERFTIAGLTAEFTEILGVDSGTVETPNARNTNQYIRPTVELQGNFVFELMKNYLWNPSI